MARAHGFGGGAGTTAGRGSGLPAVNVSVGLVGPKTVGVAVQAIFNAIVCVVPTANAGNGERHPAGQVGVSGRSTPFSTATGRYRVTMSEAGVLG